MKYKVCATLQDDGELERSLKFLINKKSLDLFYLTLGKFRN